MEWIWVWRILSIILSFGGLMLVFQAAYEYHRNRTGSYQDEVWKGGIGLVLVVVGFCVGSGTVLAG